MTEQFANEHDLKKTRRGNQLLRLAESMCVWVCHADGWIRKHYYA